MPCSARSPARPRPRALVLEWTDPPFAPGPLGAGDGDRGRRGQRARQCRGEVGAGLVGRVRGSAPDVVVAAPCGYHLDGAAELAQEVLDSGELPSGIPVWAVDANASFARPGPRLVDGIEALAGILHPGAAAPPDPAMARRLR